MKFPPRLLCWIRGILASSSRLFPLFSPAELLSPKKFDRVLAARVFFPTSHGSLGMVGGSPIVRPLPPDPRVDFFLIGFFGFVARF